MADEVRPDGAMLSIRDLHAWRGPLHALRGVDLDVRPSEIVGLFGHNGAGKSTVFKSVLGVEVRREGTIMFDGTDISRLGPGPLIRMGIGVVPQGIGVFGTLTVRENVMLGVPTTRPAVEDRVAELMQRMPVLRQKWNDLAHTLSGGQRQMVSIGRALTRRPRLLLLDEPTIGLAPALAREVMDLVAQLREEEGLAVLVVEQNLRAATRIMDRGYIIRGGSIVLSEPADRFADLKHVMKYF